MSRLLGILLVGSMALIFSVHQSWAEIKIRNSSLDNLNKAIVLLLKRDDSAACRIVDQYIETQDISVSNYEWNKLSIICSAVSGNISKATAQIDLIKFFLPGDVFIDLAEAMLSGKVDEQKTLSKLKNSSGRALSINLVMLDIINWKISRFLVKKIEDDGILLALTSSRFLTDNASCYLSSKNVHSIVRAEGKKRVNTLGLKCSPMASSSRSQDSYIEDQYKLALGLALQKDYETAEKVFMEIQKQPSHPKKMEALLWLGRVQFFQGKHEQSIVTFKKFISKYPTDKRLSQVNEWLASAQDQVLNGLPTTEGNNEDVVYSSNSNAAADIADLDSSIICDKATDVSRNWTTDKVLLDFVAEAKRRGLTCGVAQTQKTQIASSARKQSGKSNSAQLTAAQKEAERLRQELATLKAEQEQKQQSVSNDTKLPTITIASATTTGAQGIIRGRVNDDTGVAELRVDGKMGAFDSNGNFSLETYVPEGGTSVNIEAIDLAGLSSTMVVRVNRATTQTAAIPFDRLNPLKRKALPNKDAIALIIGIAKYKNTENAAYADKDALVFRDYATEKLGIPDNQVKILINEDAEIGEVLLSIRKWVRRSTKPDKTDVYVFFAGHGLATATGEAYIMPYDGRPEVDLLDRTALLQKELFAEIDKASPRKVTIFLDACYTGKARTGEVLMAEANYRPIAIRAVDDGMPDNFTLITASSGDEFSGPLEEAKHGLFSYFLMKGMEGEADKNSDNKITAGELHQYVQSNVVQQSSGSQTPELQGDAERVLVRFQ